MSKTEKVLLVVQAILIGVVFGLVAGIVTGGSGVVLLTAVRVGGGVFLTTVPVVLGIQKAITG